MASVLLEGNLVTAVLTLPLPGATTIDDTDPRLATYAASPPTLASFSGTIFEAKLTGGISFSGTLYPSDQATQNLLTDTYNQAKANQATPGWTQAVPTSAGASVALTAAQVMMMIEAGWGLAQECFTARDHVAAQIQEGALTTTAQIEAVYAAVQASF